VFRELSAELDADLRRLDEVAAREMTAFDRVATEFGQRPLTP
jgi:hypothetical protein